MTKPHVWLVVVASLAGSARGDGHPPSLLITTDWGGVGRSELDPFLDVNTVRFHGAGGLTATFRNTQDHAVLYGQGTVFFVGDTYAARVGIVLGFHSSVHYTEALDYSTSRIGSTQYTHIAQNVYPQTISGVVGLDLGASLHSFNGGSATVLEGGFGWINQHALELEMLYDTTSGTAGMRMETIYALGERDVHFGFRLGLDVYFSTKHPQPLLFTIGMGAGSGFHWD